VTLSQSVPLAQELIAAAVLGVMLGWPVAGVAFLPLALLVPRWLPLYWPLLQAQTGSSMAAAPYASQVPLWPVHAHWRSSGAPLFRSVLSHASHFAVFCPMHPHAAL
jgi:hypothetical protein